METVFEPRIYYEQGVGEFYADGRVLGAVDTHENALVIHEWSSFEPGQGNTKAALKWLRSRGYRRIVANGVGLVEAGVGDIATKYWLHMHQLGLVDTLLDDEGNDITPAKSV